MNRTADTVIPEPEAEQLVEQSAPGPISFSTGGLARVSLCLNAFDDKAFVIATLEISDDALNALRGVVGCEPLSPLWGAFRAGYRHKSVAFASPARPLTLRSLRRGIAECQEFAHESFTRLRRAETERLETFERRAVSYRGDNA